LEPLLGSARRRFFAVAEPSARVTAFSPVLRVRLRTKVKGDHPRSDAPPYAGGIDTTATKSQHEEVKRPPSFGITLATIVFPVVLMLSKALADIIWNGAKPPPMTQTVLDFIGEPLVALTLAVLLAMVTFGYAVGLDGKKISSRIGASVGPVAMVILIVGAGGRFKQTLIGAGVGDSVAKFANGTHLSILLLGYLVAVALRLATGSATVATITAAGIVAP